MDSTLGCSEAENELIPIFEEKKIKYLIVYNKCDLLSDEKRLELEKEACLVSATEKTGIYELKEAIGKLAASEEPKQPLVADLVQPNEFVVLVVPIDSAAPVSYTHLDVYKRQL